MMLRVALLIALGGVVQDPATTKVADKVAPAIQEMLDAHNVERAREKLPPLTISPLLEVAAKAHARDMAEHDHMAHEGSDGSTPSQRVVRAGYHYRSAGENVARGFPEVPKIMQMWMDSPHHKANILGDFTEVGFAVAYSEEGQPYWAADFGKPTIKLDKASAAGDLVKLINEARQGDGSPALANEPTLTKVAQTQADKVAARSAGDQPTLSFDGVDQRKYRELGMSSATGQPLPEDVLKTLKDSPDQKAAILGKFSKIGVGYATDKDGVPTWVILLGSPALR